MTATTEVAHARTTPAGPGGLATLVLGERMGERYTIKAFLGQGGMGAVYLALDEKLGEEVALKIVSGTANASMLRDEVRLAQKVTHPNVCRTYDLEDVGDHQLVKMEYVAGEHLAAVLRRDGKRSIADALRIARAIADGLGAAHAQGIVHRDLKPSNIMLADQRVVLMDFGIASFVASAHDSVAGTLGYMAPEQIANTAVDERADLYALGCVTYEMLVGEPVFGTAKPMEVAARHASMRAPDVRDKRPETPRWLARAVADLLEKDPRARARGLARLRSGPRRWLRIALPVAALAVAAVAFYTMRPPHAVCRDLDRKLVGVWDAQVKDSVRTAFAATHHPRASEAADATVRVLDRYAADWLSVAVDSCEATNVHGDQSVADMELRSDCLDQMRAELGAFAKLLAKADDDLVTRAPAAAQQLDPITRCSNLALLRGTTRVPPELAARDKELAQQMAEARAAMLANKLGTAVVITSRIIESAGRDHLDAVLAQGFTTRGMVNLAAGNVDDAITDLSAATAAALKVHADDQLAQAAFFVAIAYAEKRDTGARAWLTIGTAAASRLPDDRRLEYRRYVAEGVIDERFGNLREAIVADERAAALASELFAGEGGLAVAQAESELAAAYITNHEFAKARPRLEHVQQLLESRLGPDHVDLAGTLGSLGLVYSHLDELAKSRAAFDRSLAIREKQQGRESPAILPTLNNIADTLLRAGDAEHALAYIERAVPLAAKLGHANALYHVAATTRAQILFALGRKPEARALYDEVIAEEIAASSSALGETLSVRARDEASAGKWKDAAGFGERAIATIEASSGKDAPLLWIPLAALAQANAELGKRAEAQAQFARAFAIAKAAQTSDSELAPVRAAFARLGPAP